MYVPSPCSGAFVVHRRIRQRTPSTTTNGGKISTFRGQMASSAVVTKQIKRKGLQSVVTTVNICYKITVVDCLLTFYVCTDIYYCLLPIICFMLLNKSNMPQSRLSWLWLQYVLSPQITWFEKFEDLNWKIGCTKMDSRV